MRKPPSSAPWARRAVLLALLLLPAMLVAQENTGNLEVTVTNKKEEPLPGVNLSLVVDGKPQVRETNASGEATFENLPAGDYTVQASVAGYATKDSPTSVKMGHDTELQIVLEPAVIGKPRG